MSRDNRYALDPSTRPRSRLAVSGFALAVVAGLVTMMAGPLYRWAGLELGTAFSLLKWGAYGGLAAAAVSVAGGVATRVGPRGRGLGFAVLGLVIGLFTAYVPWQWRQRAREVPPIHDITTDTAEPPPFRAVLPLRADAPNPSQYEGDSVAALQREAYPDVRPLALDLPPDEAFERALQAARDMGWKIVSDEPSENRIEATATTFWFGFKDDVVVRITPAGDGSRVDVRSVSRVGRSDVGENAERIRDYLAKVAETG